MIVNGVHIDEEALAEICRRYEVKELALFGSILRPDFRPDSDIDVLVEFQPEASVGFLRLAGLQEDLAAALRRSVDVVPKRGLKPLLRREVLQSSRVLYAA
ncbi:MAG: nucleotidyltransferase family protein [Anaerolineae bacterium]|nr:nucleotidyltransferase family protein [Anaerolineae bacterium]